MSTFGDFCDQTLYPLTHSMGLTGDFEAEDRSEQGDLVAMGHPQLITSRCAQGSVKVNVADAVLFYLYFLLDFPSGI